MTMAQLKQCGRRLVSALRELHTRAGVVHFDVAPMNIGVRFGDDVTDVALFDFDLSVEVGVGEKYFEYRRFAAYDKPAPRVRYASLANQTARFESERDFNLVSACDDLEQLGYVLLEMTLGGWLPWDTIIMTSGNEAAIAASKLAVVDDVAVEPWLAAYLTTVRAAAERLPLDPSIAPDPYDELLEIMS